MKRKLAAMVLGMAVTLTSMSSVYAAETEMVNEEVTDAAAGEAAAEDPAEESVALWGEVMSVDEGSITISTGTLAAAMEMELPEPESGEPDEAGQNEATDVEISLEEAGEGAEELPMPEENGSPEEIQVTLLPDDEEMTVAITEDTEVYYVYGDTRRETLEQVAAEFAGVELPEAEEAPVEEIQPQENVAEEGTEVSEEGTDSNAAAEEMAEKAKSTASVEEAAMDGVLEGDLIGIILDEDGNAQTILVVLPESELITTEEIAEEDAEAADTEAIEIVEEEIVIE